MTNLNSVRLAAVVTLSSVAFPSVAQIVVDPMPTIALCGSPTLSVSFTVTAPFNAGNVFTVELSDAAGSFAAPTVIGNVAASGSANVPCAFPVGINGGSGVAIRVVASDPFEIGSAYVLPITTVTPPNAGTDAVVTLCSSGTPVVMLNYLGGTPNIGGVWTGPNGAPHPGIFHPASDLPGCYAYSVTGDPPCVGDVALLCITVVQAPDAGISAAVTVCSSDDPFVLFSLLGGSPQFGGTWTFMAQPHPPIFFPATDLSGCYTYSVPGNSPCPFASSTLCITVEECTPAATDRDSALHPPFRLVGGWNSERPVVSFPAGLSANATLSVLDAIGRSLIVQEVRSTGASMELDLTGRGSGVYLIKLDSGERVDALRFWKD